jgi:hypothetical protein
MCTRIPFERAFVFLFCKLLVDNGTALLLLLLVSILTAEPEGSAPLISKFGNKQDSEPVMPT